MDQDIYKGLPPILTAKDVAKFLRVGMNQAYEIIHEIGFRYGRTVRCTKNQLIDFLARIAVEAYNQGFEDGRRKEASK